MDSANRARLLTTGLLVAVFGSGLLVGVAWDGVGSEVPEADTVDEGAQGERGRGSSNPNRRRTPLHEQVPNLEPAQDSLIHGIIDAQGRDIRMAWDRYRSVRDTARETYDLEFQTISSQTREAIKEVMSPAQAAVYDSLLADMDRRRRRNGGESGSRRN